LGNVKDEPIADLWPKYGLVAKYKPFIFNRIRPFLKGNPHLDRREVTGDAIRITWEASQRFKPELGYDFSTYLRHLLPNRLYDTYGIKPEAKEEPDILKTDPVRFVGGGNGARLVLDTGNLLVGARMPGNDRDYLTGVLERLRGIIEPVRADLQAGPNAEGFLRALVDHAERREREAIAEAEQGGVVLLDAHDLQADVRLFKENRLLRFKPALIIEDRRSNSTFQHVGSYQVEQAPALKRGYYLRGPHGNFKGSGLYQKPPVPGIDWEAKELDDWTASADLSDIEQHALVLMRNPFRDGVRLTDTEIAKSIGVSQGYYSKLRHKVIEKLREARKPGWGDFLFDGDEISQDHSTTWVSGGLHDD
jgi:RNA polymerase sigma factor (sigma-70 family)